MRMRLGPVLVQLPPGLSFDKSLICNFFDLLKEHYSHYRFAIEVRHKSWITEDFFQLLNHYNIAFVIADSGNRFPYHETSTTDFVYLRLHGPENLYASDYSESGLHHYAEKLINWVNENKEVWVFFNNDFGGFAIKNASRLIEIVNTV
jgi:uncharacterized protein YecE (DUF72 family)